MGYEISMECNGNATGKLQITAAESNANANSP